MTKTSEMGESFIRFVHETLGSLAAPNVREDVVETAVRLATPAELPRDTESFARFLRGPLHSAMLNKLGPELTDCLAAELEHMLKLSSAPGPAPGALPVVNIPRHPGVTKAFGTVAAYQPASTPSEPGSSASNALIGAVSLNKVPSSGRLTPLDVTDEAAGYDQAASQHPSSRAYARGTATTLGMTLDPASARTPPSVLVASRSEGFVQGLAQFLEPDAVRVNDVMELLRALSGVGESRCVIVLDCRKPSIRPIALAALADELPANIQVVLWGAGPALRFQLARLSPTASAWLNCSQDDDLQSVALRCEALVG